MELLASIKTTTDPFAVVKTFVEAVKEELRQIAKTKPATADQEKKNYTTELLIRLFKSLRAKDVKRRANMAFALSELIKALKGLNPNEIYELTKSTLEMGTETVELRYNVVAIFMAWAAISRGNLFKNQKDIILGMIRNIHGFSNACMSLRTLGYQTLYAIIISNFDTTEEFEKYAYKELVAELGPVVIPPHYDSLEFWYKICKYYKSLQLNNKPWVKSPTGSKILQSLGSIYESTVRQLPNIPTIYNFLAENNAMQLINNTITKFTDTPMVALMALTAVCQSPSLDVNTYLQIFERHEHSIRELAQSKHGNVLMQAAVDAANRFNKSTKGKVPRIAAALVSTLHSKQVSQFLAQLSDETTQEIIKLISEKPEKKKDDAKKGSDDEENEGDENVEIEQDEKPFHAYVELLWGQIRREQLKDTEIVKVLYQKILDSINEDRAALGKDKQEEEKKKSEEEDEEEEKKEEDEGNEELRQILAEKEEEIFELFQHVVDRFTAEGESWLTLLSGTDSVVVKLISDEKTVIENAQKLLIASKKLHKDANKNDMDEIGDITDVDSLAAVSTKLIKSNSEFCKTLGRHILASAFEYISQEQFDAAASDAYVLVRAAVTKKFCASAIPKLVTAKKLPRTITNYTSKLRIDCDADSAFDILKSIMIHAPSDNNYIENIFTNVVGKLGARKNDFAKEMLKFNIDHIGGKSSDFTVAFLKNGKEAAEALLDAIIESASTEDKSGVSMRYRMWLNEASRRHELDAAKLSEALNKIVVFPEGDSRSNRSKQEDAMVFLAAFLFEQKRFIDIGGLLEKVKKLQTSSSEKVKKLVDDVIQSQTAPAEAEEEGEKQE